jgi:hypothetical protein
MQRDARDERDADWRFRSTQRDADCICMQGDFATQRDADWRISRRSATLTGDFATPDLNL